MRILTTLAAGLCLASAAIAQTAPAIKNPEFLDQFAATYRFRLGTPRNITVLPDGSGVLFLRSGPRSFVQDLYLFDMATGQERVLLTADQVLEGKAEQLTPEELARRERMRSASRGIAGFDLSDDGKRVLVALSGRLFVIDVPAGGSSLGITELKGADGFPIDPQFSPDAKRVACVRNGEIHVTDIASGKEARVTSGAGGTVSNGEAEFVAQEEMSRFHGYWWSPDNSKIAYQQTDTAGMETFYIADPVNPNAEPHAWPYPRAGKKNASVKLGVISASGGDTTWVRWDREAFPYLATVNWSMNAPLTILVQNRSQTEQVLLAVDDTTGATRELLREKDPAWLNIAEACPRWTSDGSHFLWLTEQSPGNDGWVLELRDAHGKHVRDLAGPSIGLLNLAHFDAERHLAFVVATGSDPTQTHLYRVSIDKPDNITPLTQVPDGTPGSHGGSFAKKSLAWVHSYSLLNGKQGWEVTRADGTTAGHIASTAEEPSIRAGVEIRRTNPGAEGFWTSIIRPRDFTPGKKYPVIDSVYGGPGSNTVSSASRGAVFNQWLADQGFIVVSIDGHGTPRRGRAWERTIKYDVIAGPLDDQALALRQLAKDIPEMDLARVGITGWSFGGYFAAHATMRMPGVFKCGVAGAPVADWRDYDTHYTERYMGLPDEQSEAYDRTNVLTYCDRLTVPLLIIHGTADDNVYFMHSLKMTGALFRAGRRFEFLPLAGFTHSVPDPTVTHRLNARVVGFLVEHLRPE